MRSPHLKDRIVVTFPLPKMTDSFYEKHKQQMKINAEEISEDLKKEFWITGDLTTTQKRRKGHKDSNRRRTRSQTLNIFETEKNKVLQSAANTLTFAERLFKDLVEPQEEDEWTLVKRRQKGKGKELSRNKSTSNKHFHYN